MNDSNIGNFNNQRLKLLRIAKGWSAAYVARRLGVRTSSVTRWESGTIRPRMGKVEAICALFEVNESHFCVHLTRRVTKAGVTA